MISFPFQEWFSVHPLVGGDWRFFWQENLQEVLSYSFAWDSSLNTGLGKSNIPILWLNSYLGYGAHLLTQYLHIPWNISEKLLFFWPIVFLSFFSAFSLSRIIIKKMFFNILSGIIYMTNTYALMIFSGGQVGVALAYSIAPFVLGGFINLIDSLVLLSQNINPFDKFRVVFDPEAQTRRDAQRSRSIKYSIIAGLILSIQMIFDPRITVLTTIIVVFYFLFNIQHLKKTINAFVFIFFVPGVVVLLLHAFWILPILLIQSSPIPQGFASVDGFRFFSFADFSHAFSLLHPNWPENIFGKTYFMRSEFLLLPILAFSSLLFLSSKRKAQSAKLWFDKLTIPSKVEGQLKTQNLKNNLTMKQFSNETIVFFAFIGLTGAFLAKGVSEPFGFINLWMFEHIPGFSVFRDPTKFYLLIVLSYSVLIPFSLWQIAERISNIKYYLLSKKIKILNMYYIIPATFLLFWLLLIFPAVSGQLRGTFQNSEVPPEYVELKDFLHKQPGFFRTLWVPSVQRFGYFSNDHPAVSAEELFGVSSIKNIKQVMQEDKKILLQGAGIKYIIVPFDSESEIFLTDRNYDDKQYSAFLRELEKISFLNKVNSFGKITVFQVPMPKDHLFINNIESKTRLVYKRKNPSEYIVSIRGGKKGELLVFSERYDSNWVARVKNKHIPSTPFRELFNSFVLLEDGDYIVELSYVPQRWVHMGSVISAVFLVFFAAFVFVFRRNK